MKQNCNCSDCGSSARGKEPKYFPPETNKLKERVLSTEELLTQLSAQAYAVRQEFDVLVETVRPVIEAGNYIPRLTEPKSCPTDSEATTSSINHRIMSAISTQNEIAQAIASLRMSINLVAPIEPETTGR